jgi:HEAT repeat protein
MRGKTESQWIKSIVYFGDENQTKLWRSFGPKGVHMLVRALRSPIYDRAAHLSVASLIDQLGDDAKSAIPDLIIQLKIENEEDVRSLELAYFEVPIQRLPESQKMALFPELLNAMQSQNANVRNNALVALQYYPSQAETVIPLMVKSLQDASPVVRLMAVKALHQVDPQNPAKSDFVPILVGCLTEEANESVIMLGMAAILSIVTCHDVFRRPPSVKKSSGAG